MIVTRSEPTLANEDRPAPRGHGELMLRVASAPVLAPIELVAAYVDSWWFVALWTLAAAAVMWEWTGLVADRARKPVVTAASAAFVAAGALFAVGRPEAAILALAVGAIVSAVPAPAGKRLWAAAGGACAGAMLAAAVLLRSDGEYGFTALVFLFAVVWTTDIFAYFVGRFVGGPKLWAAVSPKKTWSGAIGGMAAAVAVGMIVAQLAGLDRLAVLAVVSLGLSVAAQIGDFSESALKRRFGAKDASHLIPGHGGLMDRLDGFWAAAVAGTMVGLVRGGLHAPAQGLLIW